MVENRRGSSMAAFIVSMVFFPKKGSINKNIMALERKTDFIQSEA